MDELLKEELLKRMVKKCLKLGNEVKQVESEINVKRKGNVQLKQHINKMKKEIVVLGDEEADEHECWDVLEMSDCRVDVLMLNEDRKSYSKVNNGALIKYPCQHPGCKSILKSKWVYNRHQNIHKGRYRCQDCQRCFTMASQLKSHQRTHTDEWRSETNRIYRCQHPGCASSFKNKGNLTQHQFVHSDKFQCPICQRCRSSSSELQDHIRTHTGERPFKCDGFECGKTFKTKSALQNHAFHRHGDKFPFKCQKNGCEKLFKSNKGLQQHLKGFHSSERPIRCQVEGCGKRFKLKVQLTQHMGYVHNDKKEFRCDFDNCEKVYKTRQCLKRHRKTHL